MRCRFCQRDFTRGGYQRAMARLITHVKSRHPEAAKIPVKDWAMEERVDTEPKESSKEDAGDWATRIKWSLAANAVLVVVLDSKGAAHIGASGMSPKDVRELCCAVIHSTYEAQKQPQGVRLIGG